MRQYRRHFRWYATTKHSILRCYLQLKDTGSFSKRKSCGHPRVPRETVNVLRKRFEPSRLGLRFERTPQQSVRSAGRNLVQPKLTVWKVLRRKLYLKPYQRLKHCMSSGRIFVAEATIDQPTMARVGAELQQHLDICFVFNGQHIEHL